MTERLPDFVIIGAQKAGTTWLGARLAEQPGLFLPRPYGLFALKGGALVIFQSV